MRARRRRMSSLSVVAVRRARWNHIPSKVFDLYNREPPEIDFDHCGSEMILKQKIFESDSRAPCVRGMIIMNRGPPCSAKSRPRDRGNGD